MPTLKQEARRLITTSMLAITCFSGFSAQAQYTDFTLPAYNADPTVLPTGEALIHPATVLAVSKKLILNALQSNLRARVSENTAPQISFQTPEGIEQSITLPKATGELKTVLDALGITNTTVGISISPITVNFTLPESALTLNVTANKNNPNAFDVQASMSITNLKATIDKLALHIPKGVFDKAFDLDSKPITVTMKGNKAISVVASITATANTNGLSFNMTSFKTNLLGKGGANLYATLGPLTAGGLPLTPTLITNGHTLTIPEATVRAQLQSLEPLFIQSIQSKVSDALHDQITAVSKTISNLPPQKYSVNTTDLISSLKLDKNVTALVGGINLDFLLNHFSPEQAGKLYDAQLATRVSVDGVSLTQNSTVPSIGGNLSAFGQADDIGVVAYESFVKGVVESDQVEARIQNYFHAIFNGPSGIMLAPNGVKVYFNAAQNMVSAVINLEIDLRKLITSDTPGYEKVGLKIGDDLERWLGTGKTIKLPLQFDFLLHSITEVKGIPTLGITTRLPFKQDAVKAVKTGGYTSTFIPTALCADSECPTNLDDMTWVIEQIFYPQLRNQLVANLPKAISLPLSKPVDYQGVSFGIEDLKVVQGGSVIAPVNALLLTGKIQVNSATGAHK